MDGYTSISSTREAKEGSSLPNMQMSSAESEVNYFAVSNAAGDSDHSDVGIVEPSIKASKNPTERQSNIPLVSCLSSPVKIKPNNKRISF